jgi:Zn-dependent M28 family amino/carboxypeptidase
MDDIRALEAFGVRAGGSEAERRAAEYLAGRLEDAGLAARIEEFPLPGAATSRNVIARIPGQSEAVLVVGAHYDSKPPSPGANDNGSGCGVLLELATILAAEPVVPTVEIVFFGSEEIIGGVASAHHFGSRFRVAQMSAAEQAATAGMISVDMIGYGPDFHSRTMGRAPGTLSDMVLARARTLGIPMSYLKDTSSSGLSDHEAFELAGIPVSCVARRQDPTYHTVRDTADHLSAAHVASAGRLVLELVRSIDEDDLSSLLAR